MKCELEIFLREDAKVLKAFYGNNYPELKLKNIGEIEKGK